MSWTKWLADSSRIREEVGAFMDAGLVEAYVRSDGKPGLRRSKWAAEAGFPKPASQMDGDPDGKD